ncbi:hypothetical protein AB6A40_004871 [Gnathostoma spinigerum]|uniref:Protein kinase domain-containing protein n=1 Tax=Gnathostoma spinigerum TaxID=75299 RepID=A0ABD6EG00_9BILA
MTRLCSDYEILEEIGRGGFGVVYRARCIAADKQWCGKDVAVKKIDIEKASRYRISLELQALSSLRHENIVEFFEEFRDQDAQYIVMEYCKHRSLRNFVKQNGRLSDYSAAFVLRQLVSAVKYIHEKNMMHRDLSSGNVLISYIRNDKLRVKLADFGLATPMKRDDTTATIVGTPGYIAPQVFGRRYNQKADVYSLGGILYLMLLGHDPPRERTTDLWKLEGISPEGAELIKQMMDPNEVKRILLEDIRMSEFMRKADDFDVGRDSTSRNHSREIRDRSRELRSKNEREEKRVYAVQPSIRAFSNQQRRGSYRRTTSDSAFESGDVDCSSKVDDFKENRRPIMEPNERHRSSECHHSVYEQDICRRCGRRRLTDNLGGRIPSFDAQNKGFWQSAGRQFLRAEGDHLSSHISPRPTAYSLDHRTRDGIHDIIWPLNIVRLTPHVLALKIGRFTFNADGCVIFEVANKEGMVNVVAIVDTRAAGGQTLSVYRPIRKIHISALPQSPVPVDRSSRRLYKSVDEMLSSQDKIIPLYKRIMEATKTMAGRVEKIVFKPSKDCTARLMENGDFRVKFVDGRTAIQRNDSESVNVVQEGGAQATLTEEEMCMFDNARYDALELERLLGSARFSLIEPFPFHFSNISLLNLLADPPKKEGSENSKISNRVSGSVLPKEGQIPCVTRLRSSSASRRILSNLNGRTESEFVRCHPYHANDQYHDEKTEQLSSPPPDYEGPRLLNEDQYELRMQNGPSDRKNITGIIALRPTGQEQKIRISTTAPNTFVYYENGKQTRFEWSILLHSSV